MFCSLHLLAAAWAHAGDRENSTQVPKHLTPGLEHLLAMADPDTGPEFDPDALVSLLDFISAPRKKDVLHSAPRATGSPSAYYRKTIGRSLGDVIQYAYSPDIPLMATAPSSARIIKWEPDAPESAGLPRLWRRLDGMTRPIIVQGREFVVNTPDIFSGAYYSYRQNCALVLFEHRQRKVLVVVSRQIGKSGAGRKGYVLGSDENWDYLYTGEVGLNIWGLGWVRSHMFDSYGINLFAETAPGSREVIMGAFKWVRAGWNKINVVRDHHVHAGLKRFGVTFKKILESQRLPAPPLLSAALKPIEGMGRRQLEEKRALYRRVMELRYAELLAAEEELSQIVGSDEYWSGISEEEMRAALVVEKMKQLLGRSDPDRVEALLDF